jgi:hypothetical protein
MDKEEILRRLRALLEMPVEDRPITIYRLERLAGLAKCSIYQIAKSGALGKRGCIRLKKALLILENNQLVVKKRQFIAGSKPGGSEKAEVSISDVKKPPFIMVKRVHFTANGPRIEFIPTNPNSFPDLTPKNK